MALTRWIDEVTQKPFIDVREYGAVGDGVNDDTGPIQNAMDAAGSAASPIGRMVFVPRGTYKITQTLKIRRQIILQGEGGTARYIPTSSGDPLSGPASLLKFNANLLGIIVQYLATDGRGDYSVIRDIGFVGSTTTTPNTTAHGIRLDARALIENSFVKGFGGNGIHIEASSAVTPSKNANNWQIRNCRVENCGGHGLYVVGLDTNGGCAIELDCSANAGWGIFDKSDLGNTYVACHVDAFIRRVDPNDPNSAKIFGTGCYHTENRSSGGAAINRSLFLRSYAESGSPQSTFSDGTVIVGGTNESGLSGGQYFLPGDPGNPYLIRVLKPAGTAGGVGDAFTVAPNGATKIGGGLSVGTVKNPATDTALDDRAAVIFVDASGGPLTYMLPAAQSVPGRIYTFKKVDSTTNAVTIDTPGQNIDGTRPRTLTAQWKYLTIISRGSDLAWAIIGQG